MVHGGSKPMLDGDTANFAIRGFNDNLYRCRGHLKTKATVGNQPPSTETGLVQLPTGKVSQ